MTNPHRGEVSFEADGKEWTLRYSTNALCELEDDLDLGTNEIITRLQDPASARMGMVRAVFMAGLRGQHEGVTREQAGDLITEVGFGRAAELIGEAFQRAFPEAEGDARPRKGGNAGTGKGS